MCSKLFQPYFWSHSFVKTKFQKHTKLVALILNQCIQGCLVCGQHIHIFFFLQTHLLFLWIPYTRPSPAHYMLTITHQQVQIEFLLDLCPWNAKILECLASQFVYCLLIYVAMTHKHALNIKAALIKGIAYSLLLCVYSFQNVLIPANLYLHVSYFLDIHYNKFNLTYCIFLCIRQLLTLKNYPPK